MANMRSYGAVILTLLLLGYFSNCAFAWNPMTGDYTIRPSEENWHEVFTWPADNEVRFYGSNRVTPKVSISNLMLSKYLGVHETGQIVMWPTNTGMGERWYVTELGCIYSPWLEKFLGVHETGEIVMWPRCSTGEKWEIKSDGCIFNPFLKKYLGVHETGEIVMWPQCSTGEKWKIN